MSSQERTLGARARWSAAAVAVLTWSCGPHHLGGGEGGEAGEDGMGGTFATGGASQAGSGGAGQAGTGAGGGSAGVGAAGSGGGPVGPGSEQVIGCAARSWPEEGLYVLPEPPEGASLEQTIMLSFFTAYGISGDGRVVEGTSRNVPSDNPRPAPALFTLENSVELMRLPDDALGVEGTPAGLSCDGSVALAIEPFFGFLYRSEGATSETLLNPARAVSLDPTGTIVMDGYDRSGEPAPRLWTRQEGVRELRDLLGTEVYHTSPNGTLIGSDTDALFRYDPVDGTRRDIGMAALGGPQSIAVSAAGNAWIQSADGHFDSLLFWRPPAQPRSITCPHRCMPVDLSGTGEVALIDLWDADDADGPTGISSWLWTEQAGLVELSALFTQHGVDLEGRKLRAVGLSDDARAFSGTAFDPSVIGGDARLFYAVLPAAAYQ